jgi:3-deoxy-D-manno-octulosonate 8-phosphate phosphatase (KDO 8-P phosphatase)
MLPIIQTINPSLEQQLRGIRLLAMDVDGVLTDGSIILGASAGGELFESKTFHVRDGLGLSLVRSVDIDVTWITGRVSPLVERRAAELDVRRVVQWARNKRIALTAVTRELGLEREQVLYIGDDLNDLPAFDAAGVRVAVADAVEEVRRQADWTTQAAGGRGAVREVVEGLLRSQGRWDEAVTRFLKRLEQEQGHPPASAAPAQ